MLGEHTYSRRDSYVYNIFLTFNIREYWHGKAVEIAITFLPSESPLVSHILMSYEKHHSPSNPSIVNIKFMIFILFNSQRMSSKIFKSELLDKLEVLTQISSNRE